MSRVTSPTTRFSVDEFERLVGANVFTGRRVELINGRVYRMPPQGSQHMAAITVGSIALHRIASPNDWVVIQGTLRLDRWSAPDPDLMLLPVPRKTPVQNWPLPDLLIEVSDSTYRRDSTTKLRKYAFAGVRDYWIEHLNADVIEVYRDPRNPTGKLRDCHYASISRFTRGQSIELLARPGVRLDVAELLS